jgi:LuxR family maltose regulon positive regulatory protein
VTLVAAAGSGKTTVLAQWAYRDARPFAWVSVDERDNDPLILLRHVAVALDRVAPLDPAVLRALRTRARSLWTTAVPRLAAALGALDSPFVMVLDDASRLVSRGSLDVVSVLAEHMPDRSTLALAGRAPIGIPIASIRARGQVFEAGPELVALSRREAEELLLATRIHLDERQVSELVDRSEGWAAGLYLSALAVRDGGGPGRELPTGVDPYLADYFHSECLDAHSPEQLAFLTRTSILETLSPSLCDAVLRRSDSARELAAIAATNMFVTPVDRSSSSYRCHRLLRDVLRRKLEREEPYRVVDLHRRAADWLASNGEPESAIAHAASAGDLDRVAHLVVSLGADAGGGAGLGAVDQRLHLFDESLLRLHPGVAVLGAWAHARRGRAAEARRWLALAEESRFEGPLPDGVASLQPCIALLRAAMCEAGVEAMRADAAAALCELPPESAWRPTALLLEGAADALLGNADRADRTLATAVEEGASSAAAETCVAALAERALIASARGDHSAVDQLAEDAEQLASAVDHDCVTADVLQLAVLARTLLRRGRWDEAREKLTAARRLAPSVPSAFPWLAVQTHLELARAFVTLRDAGAAQSELDRAVEILGPEPALGNLGEQADLLQREIDDLRDSRSGNEFGLTPAELRLIPLLARHLTFREIADRFSVSRNTVKTQAISVYRKLGVASRSEAIEQAVVLGLLDGDGPTLH